MRYTLYSVNDWLDDEEALEVARREQYRALDGKSLELEIDSVHDRKRMNTDQLQNFVVVLIVFFVILVLLAVRK